MRGTRAAVLPVLLAAAAAVASAQEPPAPPAPDPPPASAAGKAVPWTDGWERGRVVAREAGRLALVYVRQETPPCPACKELEGTTFVSAECERLAQVCAPVLVRGGEAMAYEAKTFVLRYDVRRYPTLLVMNPAGHVVVAEPGRTVPELLAAVEKGAREEAAFAEASRRTDPEGRRAYVDLLHARRAWDEWLPLALDRARTQDDPKTWEEIARVYARVGRLDDARATWNLLSERYPASEDRPEWRVRAVVFELDLPLGRLELLRLVPPAAKALEALVARAAAEEGGASTVARAWIGLARLRRFEGRHDEAVRCARAAASAAPGTRWEASALWEQAASLFSLRDYAGSKAACQRILDAFPQSPEAPQAADGLQRCADLLPPR